MDELKSANKVIGLKQSLRAVKEGEALSAFVARDAEERVTAPVLEACREQNVPVTYAESLEKLGKACGIEVGCAVCVILK